MKYCLPVLFLLLPCSVLAQKTKKITHEIPNTGIKEVYEVLKSDTSVKNGSYKHQGTRFLTTGYYKNNKRDSLWTSYGFGKISSTGKYKDGKRGGIWEFYNYKNELETKYDFTANKIIFHKPDPGKDAEKYAVINGKDTLYTHLENPPMYGGGELKVSGVLVSALRYPARGRENNTTGKVIIAITIDENGHAINYRIKIYIKDGLAEEALRVIRLLDDDWIPGYLNNKAITSECNIPVSFNLVNQ